MDKAILVIDMPNSCKECPLFSGCYTDMCCKGMNNKGIDYPYPEDFRQDWCPLKPVPRMRFTYIGHSDESVADYNDGWNNCIRKILGE